MTIRNKREREALKRGGAILAKILQEVVDAAVPGATTLQLDAVARKAMIREDVTPVFLGYHGYPAALCTSKNEKVVHGIPSGDDLLQEGDIVSLDIGCTYDGLITDMAVTVAIGSVSPEAAKLLRVTKSALDLALATIRPGIATGDLGATLQTYIEGEGFGVIRDLVGHGVGKKLHEDLMIPNFGIAGRGPLFAEGMVIAVEPMVSAGDWHVKTLKDGWTVVTLDGSLAAHFEHTMIVTKEGVEVVTLP